MVQKNLTSEVHIRAPHVASQESLFVNPENLIAELPDKLIAQEFIRRSRINRGEHFNGSASVAKHMQSHFMREQEREHFMVLFLNGQHCLMKSEVLFTGTISTSAVFPREIIIKVLKNKAASIIIGHNHPSGTITPSSSDRAVTKKIIAALEPIDVQVLDHVIVGYGNEEYFSFADHQLL